MSGYAVRFMSSLRGWIRPPRHLLALFLGITVLLASALGFLGWRLLEQDRALEKQRAQERLGQSADLIASGLAHRLGQIDDQLRLILARPEVEMAAEASRTLNGLGDREPSADARIAKVRGSKGRSGPHAKPTRVQNAAFSRRPLVSSAGLRSESLAREFVDVDRCRRTLAEVTSAWCPKTRSRSRNTTYVSTRIRT